MTTPDSTKVTLLGPQGPAPLTPRGTWSSATAYVKRDLVEHKGAQWWASAPSTNVEPGTDGTKWVLYFSLGLAAKLIGSGDLVTGTYTVVPADNGKDLRFGVGCALAFDPALDEAFACSCAQVGASPVTFSAARSVYGFTKSFGQGATFGIRKDSLGVHVFGELAP